MKKIVFLLLILILLPINVLAVTLEEYNKTVANVSLDASTKYSNEFVYSFKWGGSPSNPVDMSSTLNAWLKEGYNGRKVKSGYIYGSMKKEAGINGRFTNRFPVFCETFVKLMVYHASGGMVSYPDDYETIKVSELKRGDLIHFENHIAIYLDTANDTSNSTWNVVEASSTVHNKVISRTPDKGYRIKASALAKLNYNTVTSSYDFHDRLDDYRPIINSVSEIEGTNKVKISGTDYKHYDLSDNSDILEPENNGIIAYQVTTSNKVPTTNWKTVNKTNTLNVEVEVNGNGTYYVYIKDVGGNVTSKKVTLTKIVIDEEKPTLGEFSYEGRENSIIVKVSGATDNKGIKEYRYYLDNKLVAKTSETTYEIKNLSSNHKYNLYYEVVDNSGNINRSQVYEVYTEIDAKSIEVDKNTIYIVKGESYKLNPKVVIDSSNYRIKYSTNNSNVSVSEDGTLTGLSSGTSIVTIAVGRTKKDVTVKVSATRIIFTIQELPVAYIGSDYNVLISTNPNSNITIVDSKLPDGLFLINSSIKGIPKDNTSGSYEITFHAKTNDSETERKYILSVKYNLEISDISIDKMYIENEYNEEIKLNYPGTVSLKNGKLPPGIIIKDNRLVGSPTEEGVYTFTIKASYMNSEAEKQIKITVSEDNLVFYLLIIVIIIIIGVLVFQIVTINKKKKVRK